MATTINKEEILKAARAMSKDERLTLIAEIAALPGSPAVSTSSAKDAADFDDEVMSLTRQFMSQHKTLLKRLAE